ncbi:Anaphase-promoting complex, cyclosome, subunit 3 [Symmachiella dynata]|uniref:Anaphase-promoting complex, cyclosome, subunit 3 n=2 Tax=Symmachiella dynata TaxID=2527995 RepID=A0A517ZT76_9PLAN|nr:Anaphase-promoting complex, cyclosome, subunit 3 [Symmachiella dynata]
MSQAEIAQHGAIEQLTERMRKFESAGLPKPPNYLLSDYLCFLVDSQLVPRETSDNMQAIYNAVRYGDATIDAGILAKTLAQLDAASANLHEIERPDIEALAEKLAEPQVPAETPDQVLAPLPVNPSLAAAPDVPALPSRKTVDDLSRYMPVANPPLRMSLRILAGGLLWTLMVLVAGYYGHDKVSSLFKKEEPFRLEWEDPHRKLVIDRNSQEGHQQFVNNRRALIQQTDIEKERQRLLVRLAQFHLSHGEYGEFYFIYDSLIRQDPNNPHHKIKFAAFLLDKTKPWYHDPGRALILAEEAVALEPETYSLRVLAEALYQTGDAEQAKDFQQQADIALYEAEIKGRGRLRGIGILRFSKNGRVVPPVSGPGSVAPQKSGTAEWPGD